MILDFMGQTGAFVLSVPRSSGINPHDLMTEHGLDYSTPASTDQTAVLFTREPFAAATFGAYATEAARAQLHNILTAIEASRAPTSNSHYDVPDDQELWGYQKADLDYILPRTADGGGALDGDPPGLGKTPTAIVWANELKMRRVCVIGPAAIRRQWAARIYEWSTMSRYLKQKPVIHLVEKSKDGINQDANWTVLSYDMARTPAIARALTAGKFDGLILDEAHMLKQIDRRRTRAIFGGGNNPLAPPIASVCQRVLALTGTPLPNRPREAYTLARHLCWDSIDWMSEDRFRERFNPSRLVEGVRKDGTPYRYSDERSGRHSELQNRLRTYFMTRHDKREVMPQLHYPIYDLVRVEKTQAVKAALAAESLLDIDPDTFQNEGGKFDGHVAAVRREMGIAMSPQVADYVNMCIDGGEEKIVVFAWHIEVLDILQQMLYTHGVVRVDGRTSASQKDFAVEQFRKNPKVKVILGNVLSLGTGTDGLQHVCNHAVIAEPDWVPGNNVQCFDRLDRGGQRLQVQGDIFVAPGSFAERVLVSALRKARNTHNALDRRVA